MTAYHLPVMVDAVVRLILEAPPGAVIDGTLGGGGHTLAIAQALAAREEKRLLIGIDQDPEALAAAHEKLRGLADFRAFHANFRELDRVSAEVGHPIAAILLDLGVSSHQLDAAHRGFAIKHPESRLDMRMDPTRGESARELLERLDADGIARVLREYGEVKDAWRIALRIKESLAAGGLETTGALARLVEAKSQRKLGVHPATLVFQALRIAVNDELGALRDALTRSAEVLCDGGRLLVMSYHSLEDRLVKHTFLEGERGPERPARLPPPGDWRPTWKVLTRQAIVADEAEIALNPRARSAKLRAAARVRESQGGAR
jgi:16S rRNA (cytosine1402-N4)-methyltransferase